MRGETCFCVPLSSMRRPAAAHMVGKRVMSSGRLADFGQTSHGPPTAVCGVAAKRRNPVFLGTSAGPYANAGPFLEQAMATGQASLIASSRRTIAGSRNAGVSGERWRPAVARMDRP